ncbi:3-deoxy-manno-octulosonate cytidylyltransferase [Litoribacter ruber]|uniref:3-deoxy-manno-octulosonate cytidylyltransferase n=1 Tax=Litoribacter ruber TaxID=702568 RepID=UPI001BD92554|nr:3-deoxy-manno-octulosonate cytidylyltransferase [Litoribacter ruber]MBT0811677.1 3-deoxy-manno-octulosonate cytidylyltransferase [Litoribacter ruber]
MKKIALIPARYAATRFPAKLTADLCGKPVIVRTYLSTVASGVFDEVVVVTDHQEIKSLIEKEGGKVFFSETEHQSGSDRIAEAAKELDGDVVVNVQGDEPFQDSESLSKLVVVFEDDEVQVASLMTGIQDVQQYNDPNAVKVVVDQKGYSMYFSRSPVPYFRNQDIQKNVYRHIGVYAYRKNALIAFTQLPKSYLEEAEMLEQLRLLEAGIKIKMVYTDHETIAIDTPADLGKAIEFYKSEKGH